MALEEKVTAMRQAAVKAGKPSVPGRLQGVTKTRIRQVLKQIDRLSDDLVDVVFALLDNTRASWFSKAPDGSRFCDGASTAHLACHVGILQRGGRKLDREGRDYWIKPLRALGAVEPVTLEPKQRVFIAGHPIAKSSNSAYRLADDFRALLQAKDSEVSLLLHGWIAEDAVRRRLQLQAQLAARAKTTSDTRHADLIAAACEFYAPTFLPGFEILYVDAGDGDRVPADARAKLASVGLELALGDPMPDVLLVNREQMSFWIVEAVTSDGEVDLYKVEQASSFVGRSHPEATVGFTTAYRTWRDTAARQSQHKNLAPGTYLWILEDSSKQFLVETFD